MTYIDSYGYCQKSAAFTNPYYLRVAFEYDISVTIFPTTSKPDSGAFNFGSQLRNNNWSSWYTIKVEKYTLP